MLIENIGRALAGRPPEPREVDALCDDLNGMLAPDCHIVLAVREVADHRTCPGNVVELVEVSSACSEDLLPVVKLASDRADVRGWVLAARSDAPGLADAAQALAECRFRPLQNPFAGAWDLVRVPRERRRSSGNPFRSEGICPECGHPVAVSTRTGTAYSHSRPGEVSACRGSGAHVAGTPHDEKALPAVPPAIEYTPRPPAANIGQADRPDASVRAWRGGLPGLGRRR